MHRIRPWLLIGSYCKTLDNNLLAASRIGALLHLAAPVQPPGVTTCYLPVEDGEPLDPATIQQGVAFVLARRVAGDAVLVACGAGISRSTSFAIAALKEAEGISLLDAARIVRRAHPHGMPHPVLWDSLCGYSGEPHSYLTLVRAHELPAP